MSVRVILGIRHVGGARVVSFTVLNVIGGMKNEDQETTREDGKMRKAMHR